MVTPQNNMGFHASSKRQNGQVNPGLYPSLDERRGSGQYQPRESQFTQKALEAIGEFSEGGRGGFERLLLL
jgi:hypothetical protein